MVTVERFLLVHEGRLYELRTDGTATSCEFNFKNGGSCPGCCRTDAFPTACKKMADVLKTHQWHWRELKWKEGS